MTGLFGGNTRPGAGQTWGRTTLLTPLYIYWPSVRCIDTGVPGFMPRALMQPAPQSACCHKPVFQSWQTEAWQAGRDSGEPRSDGLFTRRGTEDFPGWPVVETLPGNVGDVGSIPG